MAASDAYERFKKSMILGYDQWHDGIGYDLEAFRAMTREEQAELVRTLKAHGPDHDWRDIEVFDLADALGAMPKGEKWRGDTQSASRGGGGETSGDTWSVPGKAPDPQMAPAAREALREALAAKKVETRLHAAVALRDLGEFPEFESFLAAQLEHVGSYNGLSYALGLIENDTPTLRDALLRGTRDRPDAAVHFAAKLCFLAGKAKSDFDWEMRPFFLRFGESSPAAERAAAYRKLLEMIGAEDPG